MYNHIVLPAVEYIAPGYILANRNASLLVLRDVQGIIIFWTPAKKIDKAHYYK